MRTAANGSIQPRIIMPKLEQFAVILYTLRDFLKTQEEVDATFKKVAEIGYQAIQVSGMAKDVMSAEAIAATAAKYDLTICATHEPGVDILEDTDAVIKRLKTLGTKYTAYPFPAGINFSDHASRQSLIQGLNKAGAKMREAGLVLTYHNHANEFIQWDGKTALDHIYDETDPRNLQAEIDTYWVQLGGGCPVQWIEKLNGRLPLLHMKDVGVREGNQPTMFEIGRGNLDFPAIVAAAEKTGCEWFIVEQDTCPGDPFDSIAQSFEYIKAQLAS